MGTAAEGGSVGACRAGLCGGSCVPPAPLQLLHALTAPEAAGGIVPAGFPLSRSRAPAGSTLLQGKAARAETPVPDEMSSFVSGNSLKLVLSPVFQWKSFLYAHVQHQQVLRGSLLPSCGCLKHWGSDYSLSAGNIYD